MPVHDWSHVPAGYLHHFHQDWSVSLCHALNAGRLPKGFYALMEQHALGVAPDVLALKRRPKSGAPTRPSGGIAVAEVPPKTKIVNRGSQSELYAVRANKIVVRDND
ncbi:MAG TPA: hypothetical protein VK137_04690 [Planctomycetaceae bacterium]|nr:hypothetical protein [Planctomycetaceae bacterium]